MFLLKVLIKKIPINQIIISTLRRLRQADHCELEVCIILGQHGLKYETLSLQKRWVGWER